MSMAPLFASQVAVGKRELPANPRIRAIVHVPMSGESSPEPLDPSHALDERMKLPPLGAPEDDGEPLTMDITSELSIPKDGADDDESQRPVDVGPDLLEFTYETDDDRPIEMGNDLEYVLTLDRETGRSQDDDGVPDVPLDAEGISMPGDGWGQDEEEGMNESLDSFLEDDLPPMDQDELSSPEEPEEMLPSGEARDEELPPWAEVLWRELAAAGPSEGETPSPGLVLGSPSESTNSQVGMRIAVLGPSAQHIRVGLGPDRVLLRSTDGGAHFAPLDLEEKVRALSPHGEPLVVLLQGKLLRKGGAAAEGRGPDTLAWSGDYGLSWKQVALDADGLDIAQGREPQVASLGDVFAIAARDRGVAVSVDRGVTFQRVPGCANHSALTLGVHQGKVVCWLALYSETQDQTELVAIDVEQASARRIGTLTRHALPIREDDEPVEHYAVEHIAWDAEHCRLWLRGYFGLASFVPPKG